MGLNRRAVWAPRARSVELVVAAQRIPMAAAEEWWICELPPDLALADYAFSIDGGPPRPDPRSPWQPAGVHGFSRPLDHRTFRWTDQKWQAPPLSSAVIYEVHVGTFTPGGTFDAAIEKLAYLQKLGVTHLELMPVAEFPGDRGWGYDGVDLYAPHHAYGGPDGLKRLVDAAHAEGIAVLLDVVYNHFGPDGNYLANFGPYLTSRYRTPWGDAVNLDDAGSDEVRRFLCDNAAMWLRDYHLDGLRIDAVHAIFDASAIHFLEQLVSEVEVLQACLGKQLVLIAESDLNQPRIIQSRDAGGYGLDAQWNDDFHHAVHAMLTGERRGYYADFGSIAEVAKSIREAFVFDGRYSHFRHRIHGRPAGASRGSSFVAFIQNHDQVGNRARGERIGHLLDLARLKIAAALMITAPFVPMLFQGEEWNASSRFLYFTDHRDPELAAAVSRGRRREFNDISEEQAVPDPQALDTFLASRLDWSETDQAGHAEIGDWYRRLIGMRRSLPDLSDPRLNQIRVTYAEDSRWLCVERGKVIIVCNLGDQRRRIPLPTDELKIELASADGAGIIVRSVDLPPLCVVFMSKIGRDSG